MSGVILYTGNNNCRLCEGGATDETSAENIPCNWEGNFASPDTASTDKASLELNTMSHSNMRAHDVETLGCIARLAMVPNL